MALQNGFASFSPTCHLGKGGDVICDKCRPGHTGSQCERYVAQLWEKICHCYPHLSRDNYFKYMRTFLIEGIWVIKTNILLG